MIQSLLSGWQFNFWLGLACLAVGVLVISPFLLSKQFRRRFSTVDSHLESIGLLAIALAIVVIGVYNSVGR